MVSERSVNGAGITSLMHTVVSARTATDPARVSLPGIPASVCAARRFTSDALGDCPRADDLILAVSELASNAVGHSASGEGGTFAVRVLTAPRWARVEVADSGPALLPSAARNGRGLQIVAAVADRAGAIIRPDGAPRKWTAVRPDGSVLTAGSLRTLERKLDDAAGEADRRSWPR